MGQNHPTSIVILLAVHNGARFLEEQIQSLLEQAACPSFEILARDDASSDTSRALLDRCAAQYPDRLTILPGSTAPVGVVENFHALMRAAKAGPWQYVFFCDQDDVWRADKLAGLITIFQALENSYTPSTPLLVHSDLAVMDAKLKPIHPSFLRYQGIRHEARDPLGVLLAQNFVTGCATGINRPLLDLALPLPAACIMHDWWLAQMAAATGRIGFVPSPLVLYRQHGRNAVGAVSVWDQFNIFRADRRARMARGVEHFMATLTQAAALAERLDALGLNPQAAARARAYSSITGHSALRRAILLKTLGVRRQGAARFVPFYSLVTLRARRKAAT